MAVPHQAALNREWVVLCDSVEETAVLVGSERPRKSSGTRRVFETLWSTDPVVVRTATRICLELATAYRPELDAARWPTLEDPTPASSDLVRTSGLLTRMVGYLDAGAGAR